MKKILFTITIVCFVYIAMAQDANYWSSSYGPASYFTPGAVIAKNNDSGVLFYNPALLVHNKKNTASITGTIYQYGKVKVIEGAGKGYPFSSSSSDVVPLIAANSITLKTKRPITFVYAIVHSSVIDVTFTQRRDAIINVLDDSYSAGSETFIGQYSYSNNVKETSGMLATGFQLNKKMSIGITAEGQIRTQNYLVDYRSRALYNTGTDTIFPPLVSVQNYYLNENRHIGLRFRIGWAYDISDKHHVGVIVKSPLLRLGGSATILSDLEINNLKLGSIDFSLLANTRQTKLNTKYKQPVSVAAGYTVNLKKLQLYFVSEYFAKLKEYNVVMPGNGVFIRPDTSTENVSLVRMKDARNAILNVGVGVGWRIHSSIAGYLSVRSDFNYSDTSLFKSNEGFLVNTARWNNYHFQIGANVAKKRFNLRSGILFTYGSTRRYMQDVNYENPDDVSLLIGTQKLSKASNFSIGLMVSYIHNL